MNRILLDPAVNTQGTGGGGGKIENVTDLTNIQPIDISGALSKDNVQPTTPTEGDAPKTLSLKDFEVDIPSIAPAPTKVDESRGVDLAKPVDVSKTEKPVEEPVKQVETKVEQVVDKSTPLTTPSKRDYTGFDDEDKEVLEKLPNKLFDKFSGRIKSYQQKLADGEKTASELSTIKKQGIPDSYLAHKQGFILSPEYNAKAAKYQQFAGEEELWGNLMIDLKNGNKELQWPVRYDEKGNLVTQNVAVSGENHAKLEVAIQKAIHATVVQKQNLQNEVSAMQTSWTDRHENLVRNIKAAEAQYYPFFEKIDETKPEGRMAKEAMNSVDAMIAPELKSYPLHSTFLKSGALNIMLVNKLNDMQKELDALKGRKQDERKAGPSATDVAATTGGTQKGVLSVKSWMVE